MSSGVQGARASKLPRLKRRDLARRLLRFVAAVVATTGALLLVDVGLTLVWQEPISSFLANEQQADLGKRLGGGSALAASNPVPLAPEVAASAASAFAGQMRSGDPIARIELPTLGRGYVVVQGTDAQSLRKGPGHYPETPLPGQHGTVAIAGHRTTYLAPFRTINDLRPGDAIVVQMPYGRFSYTVEQTQVVDPNAIWIINPVGYDRLVLSACNPLYSASQRIVAFARLVQITKP